MTHENVWYSHPRTYGKGSRGCRVTGDKKKTGLIRKYGLNMSRQAFRENAEAIGFKKVCIPFIFMPQCFGFLAYDSAMWFLGLVLLLTCFLSTDEGGLSEGTHQHIGLLWEDNIHIKAAINQTSRLCSLHIQYHEHIGGSPTDMTLCTVRYWCLVYFTYAAHHFGHTFSQGLQTLVLSWSMNASLRAVR